MTKQYLQIKVKFEEYDPADCTLTLTVGELKKVLGSYDDDTPVVLSDMDEHIFGAVKEYRIGARYADFCEEGDEEQ